MDSYRDRNPWRKSGEARNYHSLVFQDGLQLVYSGEGDFAGDCLASRQFHVVWPDQSEHRGDQTIAFSLKDVGTTIEKFLGLSPAERHSLLDDYATPQLDQLLRTALAAEPGRNNKKPSVARRRGTNKG